jgi:hypothetical protein
MTGIMRLGHKVQVTTPQRWILSISTRNFWWGWTVRFYSGDVLGDILTLFSNVRAEPCRIGADCTRGAMFWRSP